MGCSAEGILAYGYDLGGENFNWKFRETGEYGEIQLPWYDEDSEDSFDEQLTARLAEQAGVANDEHAVTQHYGVTLQWYGTDDCEGHMLVTHSLSCDYGAVKVIDNTWASHVLTEWDAQLAHVLEVLGITPKQERPSWLLTAYYG